MTTVHAEPTTPLHVDALAGTGDPPHPASSPSDGARTDAARTDPAPTDPARTDPASWFLRVGLAFVFAYAATTSLVDREAAAVYFPPQLPTDVVVQVLVPAFAVYEIVLATMLLTGRLAHLAAVLAAITLAGIVVVNADAFDVLFRNVAIACAALALAAQGRATRPPRRGRKVAHDADDEADAAG